MPAVDITDVVASNVPDSCFFNVCICS